MIAIWGSKEHLTYVFPLWFSHDGQKSLKNVPKPSTNTSLLSAHAGSYIYMYMYIYICEIQVLFSKKTLGCYNGRYNGRYNGSITGV